MDNSKANKEKSSKQLQNVKKKLHREQVQSTPEELQLSERYKKLQQNLNQLEKQRNQIYQSDKKIQKQLNNIHDSIINLEPLEKNAQEEFEQFSKRYDFKRTQSGLSLLARRLKLVINEFIEQSNKVVPQKKQKKPSSNYSQNQDFDMVSVSDISQMTDMWDQHQNIGGLHLFPLQKEQLFNQITKKLNIASNLIENIVEDNYPPFHHKYIEQKLFKHLIEISTSEKYQSLMKIKKCNKIEENTVCLLLCDYQKQFICLSPKYILGYLLQNSQNFNQSRHFSNQIYQITVKQQQNEKKQPKLSVAQKFLASLSNEGLQHKVPRLGFENKFYYESIVSQVAFGLILQGYFNEALIFSKPGPACKIAYLFSSYEKLIYYIKQIAVELKLRNLFDKKFLFTEDQRILDYYPQAGVLNIFSIQNIFYSYDQCQSEPFLSKKKTPKQIDIEQELVEEYYNRTADIKIKTMNKQKDQCLFNIRRLQQENQYFQDCLRYHKSEKELSDRIYQNQKKKLLNQLKELQKTFQLQENQLSQLETKQGKSLFQLNRATIPQKDKLLYQKNLSDLLFRIDLLKKQNKINDSQKLRKKRMQIDEQYKDKRNQQKNAYQDHQRIKLRIKQKQKDIKNIQSKMKQIHIQIRQYQESVNSLTPQQINHYYKKFIQQNQAKKKSIQKQIPIQLQIRDQEKKKEAVVKLLISQEQERRHIEQMRRKTKQNMEDILQNSNIPTTDHYKFLSRYMKGQLNLKNAKYKVSYKEMSALYQKIIYDGISIQKLQAQTKNKQIANVKICNVIIFYLSYICNQSFRQDINDFIRQAYKEYAQNYQKRMQIQSQIKRVKTNIEYCKLKLQQLNKIPPNLRNIKENKDLNNFKYHLNNQIPALHQYEKMMTEFSGFRQDPTRLLQMFMNTLFKKIKTLQISQMHFMELLFGFFQCRIIRDCQILDFLANQYVLVRQNSVVVEQLLKLEKNKHIFAYYFDQQNKTILCRFQDVQRVILGFIQEKHEKLYQISYEMAEKQIHQKNKKRYLDQEILGYKNNEQTPQNKTLLQLTQFVNHQNHHQFKAIRSHYDNLFIGDSMMRDIKQYKRETLQFLLNIKHKNSDKYYFASHQIREYYFLEKIMANMKTFNYEVLKQVKKKKQSLMSQFERYMKS